uniref:Uncharacterized protein n=1 Tax=Glossina palpalis gambiensis TaxID=67801 RepID=A0A1B0AL26_9MUSC
MAIIDEEDCDKYVRGSQERPITDRPPDNVIHTIPPTTMKPKWNISNSYWPRKTTSTTIATSTPRYRYMYPRTTTTQAPRSLIKTPRAFISTIGIFHWLAGILHRLRDTTGQCDPLTFFSPNEAVRKGANYIKRYPSFENIFHFGAIITIFS